MFTCFHFLPPVNINFPTFFDVYFFLMIFKGSRVGMPLSRVALQSPAGAARGQVWLILSSDGVAYIFLHFQYCPNLNFT